MRTPFTCMRYMCGMCAMPEDIFAMMGKCGVFMMHRKQ